MPQVVVGSPIAGRSVVELEDVVGLFVNTLALKADFSDPGLTFVQLLRQVPYDVLITSM